MAQGDAVMLVFSLLVVSMHVTGQQLGQLTGIAAILRFPLPELENERDNDSDQVGCCYHACNGSCILYMPDIQRMSLSWTGSMKRASSYSEQ